MRANTELLQSMAEIGYMACFKGDMNRSQAIMDGIDAISIQQNPVKISVAIVRLYAGRYDEAVSILRDQVLADEPDHMSAKCFLGIALSQKGQKLEAKELFQEVILRGNEDERNIASAYLNN